MRKSVNFQFPKDSKNQYITNIRFCEALPDQILINFNSKGKSESRIVTFKDSQMENPVLSNFKGGSLGDASQILSLGSENCDNRNLLAINGGWKFSMNLFNAGVNSISKKANIDFLGFDNGFNPKFYEMNRILKMKLKDNMDGIIVLSGNCNDSNFDGRYCSKLDTSSRWYARIQYFYFNEN
jgi:hypothetical protein